jgi:hypothetical protein
MASVIMLKVIVLTDIMLSVIMLRVLEPWNLTLIRIMSLVFSHCAVVLGHKQEEERHIFF